MFNSASKVALCRAEETLAAAAPPPRLSARRKKAWAL